MVQKKYQNPKGGLNKAGRAYFKRTTGANLKPPVSAKKAKKSPKAAARRKSFCARMQGMKKKAVKQQMTLIVGFIKHLESGIANGTNNNIFRFSK